MCLAHESVSTTLRISKNVKGLRWWPSPTLLTMKGYTMTTETTDITITKFDANGSPNGISRKNLTDAQLADVINHAAQAIAVRRAGGNVDLVLNELEEALGAYAIV